MKTTPFTRVGWVYFPSSALGFAIDVVASAFGAPPGRALGADRGPGGALACRRGADRVRT